MSAVLIAAYEQREVGRVERRRDGKLRFVYDETWRATRGAFPLSLSLPLAAYLLVLTAAIRLPGVGRPLVGNFATRHVVNAMAARNWALGRAPIWTPRLDCLMNGRRALHLVELPLSAYLAGGLWHRLGGSLDVWGRLVSIGFSMAAVALMFVLVRRWHGPIAAWAAAVVLALSFFSVPKAEALGFSIVAHLVQLLPVIVAGLIALVRARLPLWPSRLVRADSEESPPSNERLRAEKS